MGIYHTARGSGTKIFHQSASFITPGNKYRAPYVLVNGPSCIQLSCYTFLLGGAGAQDVGVTGVQDSHGRAAEELTAGSAELNLLQVVSASNSLHSSPN